MGRTLPGLVLALFVCLFVTAAPLLAQAPARLTGVVKDTSGGVLPGAVVDAVVAGGTVATATTGADGRYELSVPAGVPVEVRSRRDGFADQVVSLPGVAATVTRDITMPIGRLSDTLVVTASRGAESRDTVTPVGVGVSPRTTSPTLGSNSLAEVLRFVPGMSRRGQRPRRRR